MKLAVANVLLGIACLVGFTAPASIAVACNMAHCHCKRPCHCHTGKHECPAAKAVKKSVITN